MEYIFLKDYLLLPLYFLIIILIAKKKRDKNYPEGHPLRKYYLPGLCAKLIGALFIGLVYRYYYGGGDTSAYFYHAKVINSSFWENPKIWLRLITSTATENNFQEAKYIDQMYWYGKDNAAYFICKIAAFFGILTFNSYLPTSLLFAFASFSGMWKLLKFFVSVQPGLVKPMAIACLFIPGVVIWGSGIFKDTITMAALGWLTYASYNGLIKGKNIFKNTLIIIISVYVIVVVKVYIILAFLPALLVWVVSKKTSTIKNSFTKMFARVLFYSIVIGMLIIATDKFSQELGRYSLEKITNTAEVTRNWISFSSGDDGSKYDLGDFSPSLTGMLLKFPQAVNVTLFRPYLWEANKIIILLSAIESFIVLLFTLYVLLKTGIFNFVKKIFNNQEVQFCLIFTLIFAFAVGVSTFNFGSLVRYKIPCLPFYWAMLFIILYTRKKTVKG